VLAKTAGGRVCLHLGCRETPAVTHRFLWRLSRYIGMEVAAGLINNGLDVTLIFPGASRELSHAPHLHLEMLVVPVGGALTRTAVTCWGMS
jgi:hypothetical protein